MNRYVLKGSLRSNADLCAAIHEEIYTVCPTLPTFCPECDFSHHKKLWFRRGAYMYCNKCGYQLKKSDYWLSELSDDFEHFDDF